MNASEALSRLKPTALLIARVLVGLIFVYSGFSKVIRPPEYFEVAINAYQVFPDAIQWLAARTVPWVELILGLFLILGLHLRPTAIALAGLIVAFQMMLGQALLRGLNIDECGCFGGAFHFTLYQSFLIDTLLLLIVIQFSGKEEHLLALDNKLKPS